MTQSINRIKNLNSQNDQRIVFVTLGMFIIDEIHYTDGSSLYDVIGGGGTYAAYGARFFLPYPSSKGAGWIVDAGSDFPNEIRQTLFDLHTSLIFRTDHSRLTTRGWNKYGDNEFRAFKYTTTKKRIVSEDIYSTDLLAARSFHLICSPERATELISDMLRQRAIELGADEPAPMIAWEPVPDLCTPEHLQACLDALKLVDIITPNAAEAAAFFGESEPTDKQTIERIGHRFVPYLKHHGALIIRAGTLGCVILSSTVGTVWLDAYHLSSSQDKVVDPTGGGNCFIGGMSAGYVLSGGDVVEAAVYGNVAASLAIEQVGVPNLIVTKSGNSNKHELWNGINVFDRLREYKARIGLK
ncbi:Ribokinase-like protein [Lipomyces japonicus]|uniref:Ribokinase-like protein n=1 Tax=Lipomyces japonicus TaxID=56871 RepID=UPI0034CF3327